ncbi:hypothetical protein Slin14017_G125130 [Septoria linicola]|nr:hypothetical protein Slin14017_G125130 [Septoria linicola]
MLGELDQASGSSASAEGDGSESGEMSGHMMKPWTPAPFFDIDPANTTPDGLVIESIESYINIHGAQITPREDSEAPAEQRASWSVERPKITSPDLDHVFRRNVKKFLDHTESLVAQFAGAPWSDGVLEIVRREVKRLHDELFTVIEAGWAYVDDVLWPLVTTGEELVRRAEATGWPREQHLDDFDEVYDIASEDKQHAASENLQSEAGHFWQKGATVARNLPATDAIKFCRTARAV